MYCFTFYDENNELLLPSQASLNIVTDSHIHKPELENNNSIYIPFTIESYEKYIQPFIIERDEDPSFNVLSRFKNVTENYSFVCDFLVDKEVLLERQISQYISQ